MSHKVLIVDDEPDIRELLEITLGRMDLSTLSASNLEEARNHLNSNDFHLCLTDMKLPDGNGIELVREIQSDYPHIPVAVITGPWQHGNGNQRAQIRGLRLRFQASRTSASSAKW